MCILLISKSAVPEYVQPLVMINLTAKYKIKFNLTLKKSNFQFLLCFYLHKLGFYLLVHSYVSKLTFS